MNEKKEQGAAGTQELRKYQRKVKIPKQIAEDQVQMLLDYYDCDDDFIVDTLRDPLQMCILGMIKAVTRGRLSVEDRDGGPHIIQILETPAAGVERITYRPAGSRLTKALKIVGKEDSRINAVLGALSGMGPDEFDALDTVDRDTAEAVGNYFLSV
jgi:hypothetical protein